MNEGNAAIEQLNGADGQPVLFIHGLWLEPSSWDQWISLFEGQDYLCAAPCWPRDEPDVATARAAATDVSETLSEVVNHFDQIARNLNKRPILVGHSFGGLIAQLLANRGLAAATIAIAPAAFRGVLPLPLSAVRSASPVLLNPANRHHRVTLTFDQFRYAFANALEVAEARELYEQYAVPAPGGPLFEAALANLNPWTQDRLDPLSPSRRPLLLIAGENDHTVPPAVVEAEYKLQRQNSAPTEYRLVPRRGHALVIDHGWKEVADLALSFAERFAPPITEEKSAGTVEQPSIPAGEL